MNTQTELTQEISRDHWIGAQAAGRIASGEPIRQIESEPLEALSDWIRAELQDRDESFEQEYAQQVELFLTGECNVAIDRSCHQISN